MTITANPSLRLVTNCVHCNADLDSTARFCGECGAPGDKARGQRPHNLPSFAQPHQYSAQQQHPHHPSQGHHGHNHHGGHGHQAQHHPQANQQAGNHTYGSNVTPITQNLRVVPNSNSHVRNAGQPAPRPQALQQPQHIPNFAEFHNVVPQELKDELAQLVVLLARERIFLVVHCAIFIGANLFGFCLAMTAYHQYMADELTKLLVSLVPMFVINSLALACLAPIKGTRAEISRLKEKISYVRFQIDYRSFFKK